MPHCPCTASIFILLQPYPSIQPHAGGSHHGLTRGGRAPIPEERTHGGSMRGSHHGLIPEMRFPGGSGACSEQAHVPRRPLGAISCKWRGSRWEARCCLVRPGLVDVMNAVGRRCVVLALVLLGVLSRLAWAGEDEGSHVEIRPYREIVTKDAITEKGLFTVHRVKETVLFEIPARALDCDMLWVTSLARTQVGHAIGGTLVGERVVRWERFQDHILLRDVDFRLRAEPRAAVHRARGGDVARSGHHVL